jgi:uncharacterized repeat protein (TIGR03803 family)
VHTRSRKNVSNLSEGSSARPPSGTNAIFLWGVSMALAASSTAFGQTWEFSVLHTFTGGADGGLPSSGSLIQDDSGTLYGTTEFYGPPSGGQGVVFSVVPQSKTEKVLYSFTGGADGGQPLGGVIRDAAGNLYSTTAFGGTSGDGVVFRLSPTGEETVLEQFSDAVEAINPFAGVVGDAAGNLYGTTFGGGTLGGGGTVFKIGPTGAFTLLTSFGPEPPSGFEPASGLLVGQEGNLYGTTLAGGTVFDGNIFKVSPDGTQTILHQFLGSPNDGANPDASALIGDAEGNLYGVTSNGGTNDHGVVFKLCPGNVFSVLYNFTGGADGAVPNGKLFLDRVTGRLFGTAYEGGNQNGVCASAGCGVVFSVDPSTGKETVLYAFTGLEDGAGPASGLIARQTGNSTTGTSYDLYGTTQLGGLPNGCGGQGCGTVFSLTLRP